MPWQRDSRRRAELPRNWQTIRRLVLQRDGYHCTIREPPCTGAATDVDHIGDRHDHRPENLRAACAPCHRLRTARQSHEHRPSTNRPAERHPGLL
jgi:5-methylcytosine-specific restriction protein A